MLLTDSSQTCAVKGRQPKPWFNSLPAKSFRHLDRSNAHITGYRLPPIEQASARAGKRTALCPQTDFLFCKDNSSRPAFRAFERVSRNKTALLPSPSAPFAYSSRHIYFHPYMARLGTNGLVELSPATLLSVSLPALASLLFLSCLRLHMNGQDRSSSFIVCHFH